MENYISMYGAPDFSFNYANADVADNPEAIKIFDDLRKKYSEMEETNEFNRKPPDEVKIDINDNIDDDNK